MTEPTECYRAVCRLVVCQFAHHLRLRTRVTQHVDEVYYHHVEVVLLHLVELSEETLGTIGVVNLMV